MNPSHFSVSRVTLALVFLLGLLLAPPGSVQADGAETLTETWQNETDSFPVFGSCSDPDGEYLITITTNGVIHGAWNQNTGHFTWSENGSYYLEPLNAASDTTWAGHYATHFDVNLGPGNVVIRDIFTDTGLGSDGTREVFKARYRLTLSPNGVVREFESAEFIRH